MQALRAHTQELMFDHVKFGVADCAAGNWFFLKALEPLGVVVVSEGTPTHGIKLIRQMARPHCALPTRGEPARLDLAFTAEDRQQVKAFYRAALEGGWRRRRSPVCARATTPTTTQLSSLVQTGTTSKSSATNQGRWRVPQGSELRFETSSTATVRRPSHSVAGGAISACPMAPRLT